jgi:hypothetical protein
VGSLLARRRSKWQEWAHSGIGVQGDSPAGLIAMMGIMLKACQAPARVACKRRQR